MSNEKDIRLRQHSQLPKCTKPSRDLRPNDNGTSSPINQSDLYLIVDRIGCTLGLNSLLVTRRWKEDQIRSLWIEEKVDLSSTRFHFQKFRLPTVLYSACATIRSSLSRVWRILWSFPWQITQMKSLPWPPILWVHSGFVGLLYYSIPLSIDRKTFGS